MTDRSLNPNLGRLRKSASRHSPKELVEGILSGDRVMLGKAITLVESQQEAHRLQAREVVEACLPHAGRSIRLGITGSPGVGKSTFIEALGNSLLPLGKKVAVLAIDPSSEISHGSILGDKTRMERLSSKEEVFIRPSPTGGSLGGVARHTRETILLCEAAGYDTILIETVGVGQSETTVRSMVDFFLLLLLPGAGDELQGIKRGIVEMADLIAVNKAEEPRLRAANQTMRAYRNALHLFPPKESRWEPRVLLCSALEGRGMDQIWAAVEDYHKQMRANGFFAQHRKEQARYWLHESIHQQLKSLFFQHEEVQRMLPVVEKAVLEGKMSSFGGAEKLIRLFEG